MNLKDMKAQARNHPAATSPETATDEQVAELRTLVSDIEKRNDAAAVSAAAVAVGAEDVVVVEAQEGTVTRAKSWGAAANAEFSAFKSGRSNSIVVPLQTRDALLTSGAYINPTIDEIAPLPVPTPLLGIVSVETVSTTSVEVVHTTITYNADDVAEGAVKPESTVSYTAENHLVPTVAHWTKASRQILADKARLDGFLRDRLQVGLNKKVDTAVYTAILAGTYTAKTAASLLAAIRLAKAELDALGFEANAMVINPTDFANLDIAILNGTLRGPVLNGSYWGLTPIASSKVAAGTVYVGDFKTAVTTYMRADAEIFVSDSDGDNFTKNLITYLAETRSLTVVTTPQAIVTAHVA